MKLLLSAFFGLVSCLVFAQDNNMQNGTFTQCGGVLSDSGGNLVYSNNENFTLTICPCNARGFTQKRSNKIISLNRNLNL